MWKFLTIVGLLLMVPGTAWAGGGGGGSLCPGFAQGDTISMLDSCFAGTAHFSPSGTSLTVSNDGDLPHTFTAVDGSFDSGVLQPGQAFEMTVDTPAIVRVYCTIHGTAAGEGMAGVLVVGGPTPEPVAATAGLDDFKQVLAEGFDDFRQALSEENATIVDAIVRQTQAVARLGDTQEALDARLGDRSAAPATAPVAVPTVVPISVDQSTGTWVPTTAGLAAGLALAGVLLITRGRPRRHDTIEAR